MKLKEISELIHSETLDQYLRGIDNIQNEIRHIELGDENITAEMVEKICLVFSIEKWARHNDYLKDLSYFSIELKNYKSNNNEEIDEAILGIDVFITGLLEGKKDVSKLKYQNPNGFLFANQAAEQVKEYFENKKDIKSVSFFNELAVFFNKIHKAQYHAGYFITKVFKWTQPMAIGFYNALTQSSVFGLSWMLKSLRDVTYQEIVQEQIFEKYLGFLENIKTNYLNENNIENANEVDKLIVMVVQASQLPED